MKSPIDSKFAGRRNERMILSMLRQHQRLSQSQLCRLAGIGSSTASTIVARLREKQLVLETPGTSTDRGPKPTLIELNPDCRYLFAVEINPSYVFVGLFDFVGQMQDNVQVSLGADHSVECVLELLQRQIQGLAQKHRIAGQKMLGVGVTLSGSVSSKGLVSLSSPLGWHNIPLRNALESRLEMPAFVYSNRVRLLTEFDLNPDLKHKHVLYLNVADGVGSTVSMNGTMMYGAGGRYGEIGHIVVDPNGPTCGCGNRGCVEALISGQALVRKIQHDQLAGIAVGFDAAVHEGAARSAEQILSVWTQLVESGHAYALALRDFVADHLGRIAAAAINCYDPDVIILAGYVLRHFPAYYAAAIQAPMATQVYDSTLRSIEILPAAAGANALILGVAIAALQDAAEHL